MFEVMSKHYEQIKDHLGLDEALAPSSEDEKDNYIVMIQNQKKEFRQRARDRRILIESKSAARDIEPIISNKAKQGLIKKEIPRLASM